MNAKRTLVVLLPIVAAGLWMSPCAQAQDPIHKMGRGVVNVLTSWIEVPRHLHAGSRAANPLWGFGLGLFKGAGLMMLRSGVGLFEALTFPVAYPKGFASPYEQMELPDYAWE